MAAKCCRLQNRTLLSASIHSEVAYFSGLVQCFFLFRMILVILFQSLRSEAHVRLELKWPLKHNMAGLEFEPTLGVKIDHVSLCVPNQGPICAQRTAS